MVVSFMIAAPLPWRRPLWTASPLLRTPPPRSDTASRISLKIFPGRRSSAIRQHDSGDSAALPQARPVRTSFWTRSIAKILTSVAGVERLVACLAGGVAAREAINAGQTIRPRPKPVRLTAPLTLHHAAPQQSAALADHAI